MPDAAGVSTTTSAPQDGALAMPAGAIDWASMTDAAALGHGDQDRYREQHDEGDRGTDPLACGTLLPRLPFAAAEGSPVERHQPQPANDVKYLQKVSRPPAMTRRKSAPTVRKNPCSAEPISAHDASTPSPQAA